MELTETEHNIILGTLLGDGFLQKRSLKARLRICHSYKQKDYVNWKYNQLRRLCQRTKSPQIQNRPLGRSYYFSTQSEKILIKYHDLFYTSDCDGNNFRKRIDLRVLDLVYHPLSLAVWWLDDGNARTDCRGGRLATNCFSLNEQKILQNLLQKKFQIKSNIVRQTLKKKTIQYYLSIPSNSFEQLVQLISTYVNQIPTMDYKLGLKSRND